LPAPIDDPRLPARATTALVATMALVATVGRADQMGSVLLEVRLMGRVRGQGRFQTSQAGD
jgi:hypothetical protein